LTFPLQHFPSVLIKADYRLKMSQNHFH